MWKTWSWTTAINQVDASAFEDWLVSTPTTGYSGVLTAYSRGTPWTVLLRAGADGEGRPEPDARGPQADRRARAHTCAKTGAGLGSPLSVRFDAASLILERSSRRIQAPTIPTDSITRGGARGVHAQVLMSPSIRVLEPLWTLTPASKAILPVLWEVATRASPPLAHICAGTGLTRLGLTAFIVVAVLCCCSTPCNCRRCAMRPLPLQCNNQDNQDNPSRTPGVPLEYRSSTISVRASLEYPVCTSREYLVSTPDYPVSTLAAQLFPDHPNLLASTWEPTAAMRADGYVTKPVSGRGGAYPVSMLR